jgi:nucleotide-binding universal stress UspA family protein
MSAIPIPVMPAISLKRILYTTDLSKASRAALPFVSAIARRYGSQVYAAYIWSPLPYTMVPRGKAPLMEEKQRNDANKALEQVLRSRELAGIEVKPVLASGEPVAELKRIIQENRIELAIVSTHGRTGFRHLLLGSVAEELFRTLPCPVLTVGPNISPRFAAQPEVKHILFPTDLSLDSKAVLPYLAVVAAEYQARLTVLHVLSGENHRHPSALDEAAVLKEEIQRMACHQVDPRCQVQTVVERGDPAERILAYSKNADLIGFGVHKASEFSTHFRNTIPYKVVLHAPCPVLTAHVGDGW